MQAKYAIDYNVLPRHKTARQTHHAEDAIAAEDFLMHLLGSGARILEIRHEGAALNEAQSDRMVKIAAERLMSLLLHECLQLDPAAVKHRFGFAA